MLNENLPANSRIEFISIWDFSEDSLFNYALLGIKLSNCMSKRGSKGNLIHSSSIL